jgi:class 3 adenylate cyclase
VAGRPGLGQYGQLFQDNAVDLEVLPHLTSDDLREMGVVAIGHRRKLLQAIEALRGVSGGGPEPGMAARVVSTALPQEPVAERRQLTVMFCDLVGSTALAARLDPEDLREVIGRYQTCVADTVAHHAGFVAKYMGDGVLVYFGYPQAHEDDAERAVRAGLELVSAVRGLEADIALQCRIGISTGLVVVGDLIGAGSAQEQAVVARRPTWPPACRSWLSPTAS